MNSEHTIQVAFVGNPNCGKTTLFNALTGANLKVANWPGVTVEKKEGTAFYKGAEDQFDRYAGYLQPYFLFHRRESYKELCDGR